MSPHRSRALHFVAGSYIPRRFLRLTSRVLVANALVLSLVTLCTAQTKRLVVLKADGLPYDIVDHYVKEKNPRTGKSELPWIEYIFYQRGARLANFYVRGMSLSGPSWSLLETGQHLQIKGNVEFDRFTLHSYDYLNMIPFYLSRVAGLRFDMPAVEVLDSMRIPMLIDIFPHAERYQGLSLYQRGSRLITFQRSLESEFIKKPKELVDEWTMGFDLRDAVPEQLLREILEKLPNPNVRYLDLVVQDFDHAAHHNNDLESQLMALKQIDIYLGRLWTGIQNSGLADETALILVSDHGFNSDPKIYSQGYNLVKLFGSSAGGGHHVITKRRLLLDYSIKGVYPVVPLVTTTTRDSYYLKGQSTAYPTLLLDFDGNERASVHLRDRDLNVLHILLQQLQRKNLSPPLRKALTDEFFATLNFRRSGWQKDVDQLEEELDALRRRIEQRRRTWEMQPKKFSKEDLELGRDDEVGRLFAEFDRWQRQVKEYSEYTQTVRNLLALKPENFEPQKLKIETLIASRAMGNRNSVYELQNYIVGIAPAGFVLKEDGSLDRAKSFVTIDYLSLLNSINVKNNVQAGVSNKPIDMIAIRLPARLVQSQLQEDTLSSDVVWAYGGPETQALILAREDRLGQLSFRYVPIKHLRQTADGQVHFELTAWQPGLPLRILEDPNLNISGASREEWLSNWHNEIEWLHAIHRTLYSNGLIGLHEELAYHQVTGIRLDEDGISNDERLVRRYVNRQRELIETDMLLVANNHWNFDVRGFNPGGNHGSFFRVSTHSLLMISGGDKTNIPRGIVVDEPYDSLSYVPTLLSLTGNLPNGRLLPIWWDRGYRRFPGRIITEIVPPKLKGEDVAAIGVRDGH